MKPSISVDSISKRYRIGKGLTSLRELFVVRKNSRGNQYRWALRDVSFELFSGESLGIIGPNGAGKTTILKILSRVTQPTSGNITVNGRFSALIELGAGFHPDLTGRENIFLNGTILGMQRSEIKSRFDEIVGFAGIGDYLDTPVKRYSSGMYARLGFAIAAHVSPDVLLVDEVLAVGDYAFQMKCYERMKELQRKGTTLIFVSHNMDVVRRVCEKGIVMYRGENIFAGTAAEAVIAYSDAIRTAAKQVQAETPKSDGLSERIMTFDAEIEKVELLDQDRKITTMVPSGNSAVVAMDVNFQKFVQQPFFSLTIRTPEGRIVYDTTTRWQKMTTPDFSPGDRVRVEFAIDNPLLEGEYQIGVDVGSSDFTHYYDRMENAIGFWVRGSDKAQGVADLKADITIHKL